MQSVALNGSHRLGKHSQAANRNSIKAAKQTTAILDSDLGTGDKAKASERFAGKQVRAAEGAEDKRARATERSAYKQARAAKRAKSKQTIAAARKAAGPARPLLQGSRRLGMVTGIALLICCLAFYLVPGRTATSLGVVLAVAVLIRAVYRLGAFLARMGGTRNILNATAGVLWGLVGIYLMMFHASYMFMPYMYVLGTLSLISGVMQISYFSLIANKRSMASGFVSGVLSVACGAILYAVPIVAASMQATNIEWICGIYILFAGLALIAESFVFSKKRDKGGK
jgi:uncharacterized membrane protein HdeD (DUF308 family)